MATWQVGPFDNDDAVEWLSTLEMTQPDGRLKLTTDTFRAVALAGTGLTATDTARAIAAAATVLQCLTGAPVSNSPYAPQFLAQGSIHVAEPLRELAIRTLDVILVDGSPWRQQWANHVEEEDAIVAIQKLRNDLIKRLP
ncbi:DUF4259 domain-containing protein [Phytohabitans kaempferiae]|uniref:DUF4259 domain-containing protein n=1 Tax=Phytohabitans kaempferiae TaxID=1620943 RepID=A0ABV6MEC2_9ACTN